MHRSRVWNPLQWPRRAQVALLLVVPVFFFTTFLLSTSSNNSSSSSSVASYFSSRPRCSPTAWEQGSWVQRPGPYPTMAGPNDVYRVSGFSGCSSSMEPWFHLSNQNASMWDWRAKVSTFDWKPSGSCNMAEFDKQKFILGLVKDGGWHLVGDSITEGHFFSLSCMLHPYVRAGPVFSPGGGWKRSWPQFLYLDARHPWVQQEIVAGGRLPLGFDISVTPIVAHKRIDLLFSLPELADVGAWIMHPTADPGTFFKNDIDDKEIWTQSALEWIGDFQAMLPAGRYNTLVLSTGVHWVPDIFVGAKNEMADIVRLWRVSMNLLTARLIAMLDADESKRKVVLFRAAPSGSEGCLKEEVRLAGPLKQVPELREDWFNWRWLPHMNDVLEEIIRSHNHPRLRFLRLDRPGLLRPDARALSDCSHFTIGSGVVEDWTRYMAHFIEHEIDYIR